MRTAAVLCTSLPLVLAAGQLVDGQVSWLWLLPAAGFIAAVLAISTWITPVWPAAGIAVLWLASVAGAATRDSTELVLADASLVLYALLAAVCLVIFAPIGCGARASSWPRRRHELSSLAVLANPRT